MSLSKRPIGPFEISPIGLGCMSLSHAYGTPPQPAVGARLLNEALDLGYSMLDTAALYGFGANETLIGEAVGHRRSEYLLASKCGMTGVNGNRLIDGRPDTLRRTLDEALSRLSTEVIDLYYLHRWDKSVPVEESVGALADMVIAGKVRSIGLSEVSPATLRRAHAVHPISAVQNEYSPWSREVENGLLAATAELGVALVAFSPIGRGFLAGAVADPEALVPSDIRRAMPRFQGENFAVNLRLAVEFAGLATEAGCTPAQLSLAWLLARGSHVIVIPGTTSTAHLAENLAARDVVIDSRTVARIHALFAEEAVAGARYNEATQRELDTEH